MPSQDAHHARCTACTAQHARHSQQPPPNTHTHTHTHTHAHTHTSCRSTLSTCWCWCSHSMHAHCTYNTRQTHSKLIHVHLRSHVCIHDYTCVGFVDFVASPLFPCSHTCCAQLTLAQSTQSSNPTPTTYTPRWASSTLWCSRCSAPSHAPSPPASPCCNKWSETTHTGWSSCHLPHYNHHYRHGCRQQIPQRLKRAVMGSKAMCSRICAPSPPLHRAN